MGCEILKRSIWVGACLARRLRKKMQAATARRARTAAVTPIPMPILAASVIPAGLASSELLEVAAAPAAEVDAELVTTLVGTGVAFVDEAESVDSTGDVVDDSEASDVVEVSGYPECKTFVSSKQEQSHSRSKLWIPRVLQLAPRLSTGLALGWSSQKSALGRQGAMWPLV